MHEAMHSAGHRTTGVLRDDLGDGQVRPRHQVGTTARARLPRAEGFARHINGGTQAIADEQQGVPLRTGDQPCTQVTVTTRADRPAQPPPDVGHHRQRRPAHAGLGLDVDLIGLHLHQVTWLNDFGLMHRFAVHTGCLDPLPNRLGLKVKGKGTGRK